MGKYKAEKYLDYQRYESMPINAQFGRGIVQSTDDLAKFYPSTEYGVESNIGYFEWLPVPIHNGKELFNKEDSMFIYKEYDENEIWPWDHIGFVPRASLGIKFAIKNNLIKPVRGNKK